MVVMRAWGKEWMLSADDLKLPCACAALVRSIWCALLVGTIIALNGAQESSHCDSALPITIYLYSCLAASFTALLISVAMAVVSQRGTIQDPAPRATQPLLLTLWVSAQLFAVGLAGFGLAVVGWSAPCELQGPNDELATMLLTIVIVWQIVSVCWLLCLSKLVPGADTDHGLTDGAHWTGKCHRTFRCLAVGSCCLFGGWTAGRGSGHVGDAYTDSAKVPPSSSGSSPSRCVSLCLAVVGLCLAVSRCV